MALHFNESCNIRIGLTCTKIEAAIVEGKIDGIGTYTKNLYESLTRIGQNIIPYSFPNINQYHMTSGLQQGRFFNYSYSVSTIISLLNPTKRCLHGKLKQHIDILHSTDHCIPRMHDIPVVATLCDPIAFSHFAWYHNSPFSILKKKMRKKTLQWADHYITISNTMVKELVENVGIKEEKISRIYLGIAPTWFEKTPEERKQQLLIKFKLPKQFLLVAGTLQCKKNIPRTIQAYLQLPKDIQDAYPLVIAGRPGRDAKESLAAIQVLITKKKGFWLNYVSIDELRALFQCATIHVHASLHEGFGLTLLEAFASGTPVITSHIAALPEIADGAAHLVNPYSVDEISHAMKNILTNQTLRDTLAQKGTMRAQDFTWEQCARETLKVYQSLLK